MSVFIVGKCLGTRLKEQVDRKTGEIKKTWLVGVSVPKENAFEGESDTFSIKVRLDQEQTGILQTYAKLSGQQVMVPVRPFPYSMDGDRGGISWSLAGHGRPCAAPKLPTDETPKA